MRSKWEMEHRGLTTLWHERNNICSESKLKIYKTMVVADTKRTKNDKKKSEMMIIVRKQCSIQNINKWITDKRKNEKLT